MFIEHGKNDDYMTKISQVKLSLPLQKTKKNFGHFTDKTNIQLKVILK